MKKLPGTGLAGTGLEGKRPDKIFYAPTWFNLLTINLKFIYYNSCKIQNENLKGAKYDCNGK
jgi:hypothetical protein